MWSKKEIIIFLAGAQTFHTLSHILIALSGTLPIKVFNITMTQQFNIVAIVINVLIAAGLIWWAENTR